MFRKFTIKMEKMFKCGTWMFHLNLIMPRYKIWTSGNISIRFEKFVSCNLLLKLKWKKFINWPVSCSMMAPISGFNPSGCSGGRIKQMEFLGTWYNKKSHSCGNTVSLVVFSVLTNLQVLIHFPYCSFHTPSGIPFILCMIL